MRLTVIGMSGSYPSADSPASCYLVEAGHDGRTFRLLLDLGSGSLGPLQRYIDLADIDAVLLSHLHADHCLDMCGLYVARRYYAPAEAPPIPVYGPTGTPGRLARAYDLPPSPGMTAEFDFQQFPEAPFSVGPFTVTATRVVHPVAAFALRIESRGSTLAYSGDSGSCDALTKVARSADLFLCEASFVEGADNPPDLHLTGKQAAEHATRAGAARLVLTHVPPAVDPQRVLDDARPAFDGQIDLAATGATYSL
ncbi:MAG TPA: MBL fold metallo-hydrolase [Nocardioidaceae bacterium]|nr:MBL fold metallo-hydrolase [Nocardioidaceae bacterium]